MIRSERPPLRGGGGRPLERGTALPGISATGNGKGDQNSSARGEGALESPSKSVTVLIMS